VHSVDADQGPELIRVQEAGRAGNVRGAESDDEVVLPAL
jgi:hypothetical protein